MLRDQTYEKHKGPGGKWQWRIAGEAGSKILYPDAHDPSKKKPVMMLTTDIALTKDESYKALVERFAADEDDLGRQFSEAW